MSQPLHSAAASALGYLFQSQWPLLELIRGSAERPDVTISVELHDDVAWEQDGTPIELLQLKHHPHSVRTLGDRDIDLWRTIRSWMDTRAPGDPNGPTLSMVTTQTAAEGSAAAALRPEPHNPQIALRLQQPQDTHAQPRRPPLSPIVQLAHTGDAAPPGTRYVVQRG
jgi:hypothetical protein